MNLLLKLFAGLNQTHSKLWMWQCNYIWQITYGVASFCLVTYIYQHVTEASATQSISIKANILVEVAFIVRRGIHVQQLLQAAVSSRSEGGDERVEWIVSRRCLASSLDVENKPFLFYVCFVAPLCQYRFCVECSFHISLSSDLRAW